MKKIMTVLICCVLCACSKTQTDYVLTESEIESLVNFGLVSSSADLKSLGLSKDDTAEILSLVVDFNVGKDVSAAQVIAKVKNPDLKKRLLLLSGVLD